MLTRLHQVRDAMHNAKRFAVQTFHHGRKFAQQVDSYAGMFRRGLSLASPLLQNLGAGDIVSHGERAISQFDRVRDTAVDIDRRISEAL